MCIDPSIKHLSIFVMSHKFPIPYHPTWRAREPNPDSLPISAKILQLLKGNQTQAFARKTIQTLGMVDELDIWLND